MSKSCFATSGLPPRVYLEDAGVPEPGTLFANPDLARTYRRIVEEAEARTTDRDEQIQAARDAFYRGFVAEAIDGWVSTTPVMDTSEPPPTRGGCKATRQVADGEVEDPTVSIPP
jgi:gamma-glutamyltranspeptidase / glutathione hydrolase